MTYSMQNQQSIEWQSLETDAGDLLRQGHWILRLSCLPSFGDAEVIGLIPGPQRSTEVLWRKWHRTGDIEKFRTPVERLKHPPHIPPTISERRQRIDDVAVARVTAELSTLEIPAFPLTTHVMIDGIGYELHATGGSSRLDLRWNFNHPQAWRPLMCWYAATWKELALVVGLDLAAELPDFAWEERKLESGSPPTG